PAARSSSSMMVTFWPLGVDRECNCRGCCPRGRGASCVGPAIGLLVLKPPDFSLSQVQTLGGTYSVIGTLSDLRIAASNSSSLGDISIVRARGNPACQPQCTPLLLGHEHTPIRHFPRCHTGSRN